MPRDMSKGNQSFAKVSNVKYILLTSQTHSFPAKSERHWLWSFSSFAENDHFYFWTKTERWFVFNRLWNVEQENTKRLQFVSLQTTVKFALTPSFGQRDSVPGSGIQECVLLWNNVLYAFVCICHLLYHSRRLWDLDQECFFASYLKLSQQMCLLHISNLFFFKKYLCHFQECQRASCNCRWPRVLGQTAK